MRCLTCDAVLAATAKFCSECGAPVPVRDAPAEVAERRPLSILFCDLVGSTPLSARLDPEELRDVIGAYHRCVAQTVEPLGGYVARYAGDGALVYFGFPQAFEDSATRAVRAAVTLLAAVGSLDTLGGPLAVRIGIATGLVVVGELVNAGAAREQTALGETPNLAARLQGLAEPGGIVIADTTRRLIGDAFELLDLGALELKGFAAPVKAWSVVGARRREGRVVAYGAPSIAQLDDQAPSAPEDRLIGRERECSWLHGCWNACREGRGRAAVVVGEPGIGKSRLVQAFAAGLAAEPHYELEFRCSPYHANAPLHPVIALLPRVVGWTPGDSEPHRVAKLEAFCTRLGLLDDDSLPLLLSLAGVSPGAHALRAMSPDRQKQRTLEVLVEIPLVFAAERPLLMLVEDVQWIDPTTLEFLVHLVDRVSRVPVLVVFTARSPFQFRRSLAAEVLELARLSHGQSEELVARVAHGQRLPREIVADVVARTDGVPLFIEELTKSVLESASEQRDADSMSGRSRSSAIPLTLHDSLTARLDRLGPAKNVAQLAAMLGREFSFATLRALADTDDAELQRTLDRLVDADFIHSLAGAEERTYVFRHALVQEAAYQSLLRSTRQRYHARIADLFASRFDAEADASPEIVAIHYTEAGQHEEAVHWWQRAGQHAAQRAGYTEAVSHYSRALALLAARPESAARDQLELALQVELGYALIPQRGWGAADTARAFSRAGVLSQRVADTPQLFRALWGLAAFHFVRGDQRAARRVADQCLATAQADDADVLIEAHYISGTVACAAGEFGRGRGHLQQCIRLHGDDARDIHWLQYAQDAKASALGWLALALWTVGEPDEALARATEAVARVNESTPPFVRARALGAVGFVRVLRGEPQGEGSPLGEAIALCAEQRFAYFHAMLSCFGAMSLTRGGRLQEGIARLQHHLARVREIGSELLLTIVYAHLAEALGVVGAIDEGLEAVAEGLACVERNGEHWGEAELHRVRGDLLLARTPDHPAQAETALRLAAEIAASQGAVMYALRTAMSLARLCAQTGRREDASAVLAHALAANPALARAPDFETARELHASLQ